MKKIITLITVIAAFLTSSFNSSAQFRYGAMVGVDLTTLRFNQNLCDIDKSVGYNAGVQCEMMFPGIGFGINFGLQYQQRGATLHMGQKEIWSSQGIGTKRSYLHYAAVPINLRFKCTRMNGLEDIVAPYAFGGPMFGFLVGHSKNPALEYAGADLGLQAGIGFEIMKRWQVEGGYMWGMTYALKTKLLEDFVARNRGWSIRVVRYF